MDYDVDLAEDDLKRLADIKTEFFELIHKVRKVVVDGKQGQLEFIDAHIKMEETLDDLLYPLWINAANRAKEPLKQMPKSKEYQCWLKDLEIKRIIASENLRARDSAFDQSFALKELNAGVSDHV